MKSNFVEKRAYLMVLKMESRVAEALREKGIKPSKNPPIKLIVEADKK
jgi:isopentenyl phosphate kinase